MVSVDLKPCVSFLLGVRLSLHGTVQFQLISIAAHGILLNFMVGNAHVLTPQCLLLSQVDCVWPLTKGGRFLQQLH